MNPWAAIVGRAEDGRGEATLAVVEGLRAAGLRVGGFVQRPVVEGDALLGWDAVSLADDGRCPIARAAPEPDLCEWRFDRAGLDACRQWATAAQLDVVVIEAGPLEARRQGHWGTLQAALSGPPRVVLVALRPSALAAIALGLADPVAGLELPAQDGEAAALAGEIARAAAAL